jgi:uncharacterized protein (DUF488 family)
MIYTSSYNDWKSDKYKPTSISADRGKSVDYTGECYLDLAPKKSFWRIWKDNIGIIPEEENNKYYIQEYWNLVLSKLNPEKVYQDLNNCVLLCYEKNMEFCHRHLVAAWLELFLDIKVPEIKGKDNFIEEVNKPTNIKLELEKTIKQSIDMKGFNSLSSLYLSEKETSSNKKKRIKTK